MSARPLASGAASPNPTSGVILVSACLLGQATRYDGGHCLAPGLAGELANQPYIALCPELMTRLGVPRPPVEIVGGRPGREGADVLTGAARVVVRGGGADVTGEFIAGARAVLELAQSAGVTQAWLKDRSPSCAWDPKGQNPKGGPGMGVAAALLSAHGIAVREVRAPGHPPSAKDQA